WIEAPNFGPRSRQLPESERVVALNGEDREGRSVEREQRRGVRALDPGPAQEREGACPRERGRDRLLERDRGIEAKREQRRGAERAKHDGTGRKRARDRSRSLHAFRHPRFASRLLADCSLSRKVAFGACGAPHSGPIWRLCALKRLEIDAGAAVNRG